MYCCVVTLLQDLNQVWWLIVTHVSINCSTPILSVFLRSYWLTHIFSLSIRRDRVEQFIGASKWLWSRYKNFVRLFAFRYSSANIDGIFGGILGAAATVKTLYKSTRIRVVKKDKRLPTLSGLVWRRGDDSVQGWNPFIICPAHHQIPNIHNQRIGRRFHTNPLSTSSANLQANFGVGADNR